MKRFKQAATGIALAAVVGWAGAAMAQAAPEGSTYQGKDLFGQPMYTKGPNPVNVGATETLLRAVAEAKAAYEADMTVDSATWYARLLGYQGLARESIAVTTNALKKYPDSPKLLRHRAHRYFGVREFDKSIEDGLKSAKLYEGKPLEREKLGPAYFPASPDVVQFYTYYHLGQAYFAKHDFDNAAKWFHRAREIGAGTGGPPDETASIYWEYLSLARATRYGEAKALLDDYKLTLFDLRDNPEGNNYFDGIQLFKQLRDPADFFSARDTGKAFSTSDGIKSSTSYSLAQYYILRAEYDKAKPYLRQAMQIETWSFFARIQAEADWVLLFGNEKP